jgi:hypothetical protein
MGRLLFSPTYAPLDHAKVVDEPVHGVFCDAWQEKLQTRLAPGDQLQRESTGNHIDDHRALD